MYACVQCSRAALWFIEWNLAPSCSVLFCGLASTLCHEWGMRLVWGHLQPHVLWRNVFCCCSCQKKHSQRSVWLGKCSPWIAELCMVCVIATLVPEHVDNSVPTSSNNKTVVVIHCVSVWSFPALWASSSTHILKFIKWAAPGTFLSCWAWTRILLEILWSIGVVRCLDSW